MNVGIGPSPCSQPATNPVAAILFQPAARLGLPANRNLAVLQDAAKVSISGAITQELHKAQRLAVREHMQPVDLYGGLGRNRTTDTRIFNMRESLFQEISKC